VQVPSLRQFLRGQQVLMPPPWSRRAQSMVRMTMAITPMNAWGADDFGDRHVRFIYTNEPEDRLVEAANRIAVFVDRHYRQG
jgi:hypothetical protein